MNIASPPIQYMFLTKEKVEDVRVEIVHELMLEEKNIYISYPFCSGEQNAICFTLIHDRTRSASLICTYM